MFCQLDITGGTTTLFIELENKFTGAATGYIRVPHFTVADDITLTSNFTSEMQVMVPVSDIFANRQNQIHVVSKLGCHTLYGQL